MKQSNQQLITRVKEQITGLPDRIFQDSETKS